MIDRVTVAAYSTGDNWTVRLSYSDTAEGKSLYPPQRFWRGTRGEGPADVDSIGEVVFWLAGELSNMNYGPSLNGEPDPMQPYQGEYHAEPWADLELHE